MWFCKNPARNEDASQAAEVCVARASRSTGPARWCCRVRPRRAPPAVRRGPGVEKASEHWQGLPPLPRTPPRPAPASWRCCVFQADDFPPSPRPVRKRGERQLSNADSVAAQQQRKLPGQVTVLALAGIHLAPTPYTVRHSVLVFLRIKFHH